MTLGHVGAVHCLIIIIVHEQRLLFVDSLHDLFRESNFSFCVQKSLGGTLPALTYMDLNVLLMVTYYVFTTESSL